jgi:hypothetical protein
VELLS